MTQSYRRHWTMHVELGLTATLSIKMDLVTAPTVLGLIAPMQSTAIFRRRVKLKAPVILLVPQLFLHLTLVLLVVLSLPAPALPAPAQLR